MAGCNEPTLMTAIDIPHADTQWCAARWWQWKPVPRALASLQVLWWARSSDPACTKVDVRLAQSRGFSPAFKEIQGWLMISYWITLSQTKPGETQFFPRDVTCIFGKDVTESRRQNQAMQRLELSNSCWDCPQRCLWASKVPQKLTQRCAWAACGHNPKCTNISYLSRPALPKTCTHTTHSTHSSRRRI